MLLVLDEYSVDGIDMANFLTSNLNSDLPVCYNGPTCISFSLLVGG